MVIIFFIIPKPALYAQELDVPYVPTPSIVVEKMLDLAELKPGDYLIDLGSGDGRIVIAAAKRGAMAHGIDIDPQRIAEANNNAREAGVDNKVIFVESDIFSADFSRADVVTMYLLHSVNVKLRPFMLEKLRPGTRIISHDFDMDDWAYDEYLYLDESSIYKWIVPAKVKGKWSWNNGNKSFTMIINQEFQKIRIILTSDGDNLIVYSSLLSGDKITITAENPSNGEHYLFNGRVNGKEIVGTVQIRNGSSGTVENWNANYM
ncbi:MAG: class I SAM-dependent methyltransferase [Bacteroidales bacterium]|nr:class I SAM-dependent methyltransferase [Bacteroidales bacterium]